MASVCATSLLAAGALAPTAAAAHQNQSGLVNVAVGDVTIRDINVNVAANVLAGICANVDANVILGVLSTVDQTGIADASQVCDLRGPRGDQVINITNA